MDNQKKLLYRRFYYKIAILCFSIFLVNIANAKEVKYNFDINYKNITVHGKTTQAMVIGNTIPAPTIEATEGDTLVVTFNNKMQEDTSIHWHGVLLPNDQDGVPDVTSPSIKPNTSFTFHYKVKQSGTYWYHSHSRLQEQKGLAGAIIFHEKNPIKYDYDYIVFLSDWTNTEPQEILKNLQAGGHHGNHAVSTSTDVKYDAFFINGKESMSLATKPDKTIRLRIINGGASTYFNVNFAGGAMKMIAADGSYVQPVLVNTLRIGNGESYDILVKLKDLQSYELRATADDNSGYASLFLGEGNKVLAPNFIKPQLKHMAMPTSPVVNGIIDYFHSYENLTAGNSTKLNKAKVHNIDVKLTGDMDKYTWDMTSPNFSSNKILLIKQNEVVRIKIKNTTMMDHPMHLHGYLFRVINGQGDKSPLKHTINVPPMQTVTIELQANEKGNWLFHCHNLYHMVTGMVSTVVVQ